MANKFRIQDGIIFPDGTEQTTAGGGGTSDRLVNGDYTAILNNDGSLDINNVAGAEGTAAVTQEGGAPGSPPTGAQTITANVIYSPEISQVQVGWTVTGAGITATTTVTSVSEINPGFWEIVTDTEEAAPFLYNEVYTFTGTVSAKYTFGTDGIITLPTGGIIRETVITDNPTIELEPADALDSSQKLIIKGGGPPPDLHLHLTTGQLENTSIFLGTDEHNVRTTAAGGISISSHNYSTQATNTWTFDITGVITLPQNGDIVDSNGNSVLDNTTVVPISASPPSGPTLGQVYYDSDDGNIYICTDAVAETWVDSSPSGGGTTLPADAVGYLRNDGSGTLSWTTSTVAAGTAAYSDVWVISDKNNEAGFWTEYTLTGSFKQLFDWQGTGDLTLTNQSVYGREMAVGSKVIVVNDTGINSNDYGIVFEFPSSPAPGDTFSGAIGGDTVTVTAGNFVVGRSYTISSVGTTNFVSIGASNNSVGVSFTATGVGTGNGTAYTAEGVGRRIYVPAAGQRAKTIPSGGSSVAYYFGPGESVKGLYTVVGTQMDAQPVTWVYVGVIDGTATWYQMYF